MGQVVDFEEVSTAGLESSPVAAALAGLRAHEARYFWTRYQHRFEVEPASRGKAALAYLDRILAAERDLVIAARPLQVSRFLVGGIRWTYAFYQSGLAINVLYTVADAGKRAVGFKLAEGMEVPAELAGRFKFARMKSRLAGVIRGSFFVIRQAW